MQMRRAAPVLLAVAVVAIVVIGLTQASGGGPKTTLGRYDITAALGRLDGSPAPLAALHAQQSRLLNGGRKAFRARVAGLRGHPVVVNKWASWCTPCRQEFRFFQQAATDYGKRVAFLGVDGNDNLDAGRTFLREFPVPFPSYSDDHEVIARAYEIPAYYPITLFIGADGKPAYTHSGQYKSYAALKADIKRYLRA